MGDKEILETYSNSASKNTSETDIFPHGPKSLLTSVFNALHVSGGFSTHHQELIKLYVQPCSNPTTPAEDSRKA